MPTPPGSSRVAASVIVSTYEQPEYLELALEGYALQSCAEFELIVADDGSGSETEAVIDGFRQRLGVPLVHVRQEDLGFRKARVLDLAVLRSRGATLIFSDGDCIPPADFVSTHLAASAPRTFVAGGHVRLSREVSASITVGDVRSRAFEKLEQPHQRRARRNVHYRNLLYLALGKRRKPKLLGLNFSVDRASLFEVNGFDATFEGNARDDSDLRNRLRLAGVRPRSLWHRSVVFHLWHPSRPTRRDWTESAADAYYHRADLPVRAPRGLAEVAAEEGLEGSVLLAGGAGPRDRR